MRNQHLSLQRKPRRARRSELKLPVSTLLGGLFLAYLTTAALVGFIAG